MKIEMDVRALYHGVDFETGTEFYMARIGNEEGGETEVPISMERYSALMASYLKSAKRQLAQAEQSKQTPEKGKTNNKPRTANPAEEEPVRVVPRPQNPVRADEDGFSPVDDGQ